MRLIRFDSFKEGDDVNDDASSDEENTKYGIGCSNNHLVRISIFGKEGFFDFEE